jgi:dTDP-glucose 4,6-dehydratase
MTILVTGGSGFIGSNFIHLFMNTNDTEDLINVDCLTYSGNEQNNRKFLLSDERYSFRNVNILDPEGISVILRREMPRAIIHFAAESHVDRSIRDSFPFVNTNVLGTVNLLECVKKNVDWDFKFIHVSTDEVYGSLSPEDPPSNEDSPYLPNSPYSASKAASDHFVRSYHRTHGIPTIITNCSNNYGPMQNVEKLIPVIITQAMQNRKIPIYGTGNNIRDWIYVKDHCEALLTILENGVAGEKYNIGGDCQLDNLAITKMILDKMGKSHKLIKFIDDRKGHDFRYDIDSSKIKKELGWTPKTSLDEGLSKTIDWYTYENTWNNYSRW